MNDLTKADLIPTYKDATLADAFKNQKALDRVIASITSAAKVEADVTTEKGREAIASMAYKVARSKTGLEAVAKPMADKAREESDRLNALRRHFKDELDGLRDRVRKPVNDWEAAEKQRISNLHDRLSEFTFLAEPIEGETAGSIAQTISRVEGIAVDGTWQEHQEAAADAKADTLLRLRSRYNATKLAEEQEDELRVLREAKAKAEEEEAERKREDAIKLREQEAAEAARKKALADAAEELEREKDKAEREIADAERQARETIEEAKRQSDNERARFIEEDRVAKELAAEKSANEEHRTQVRRQAAYALQKEIDWNIEQCEALVGTIEAGLIPHITINF